MGNRVIVGRPGTGTASNQRMRIVASDFRVRGRHREARDEGLTPEAIEKRKGRMGCIDATNLLVRVVKGKIDPAPEQRMTDAAHW